MLLPCRGGPHTSLMFCTNGVLLRMLTQGEGLDDVTHIVVDEVKVSLYACMHQSAKSL